MSAKVLRREERRRIDDLAAAVGLAHDLGTGLGVYGAAYGFSTVGCGIFLIIGGVLIGLPGAGAVAGLAVAAVVVAGLVALGVVLIKVSPREKVDWVFVYTGGIAQLPEGAGQATVIPWGRLGQVVKNFTTSSETEGTWLSGVTVTGADGTQITMDGRYGSSSTLDRFADQVDGVLVEARLPLAMRLWESGRPVVFGEFVIAPGGISWGKHRFGWVEIKSLRISADQPGTGCGSASRSWDRGCSGRSTRPRAGGSGGRCPASATRPGWRTPTGPGSCGSATTRSS